MTTGQRIAALRKERSMTQPMLAEKMNVSQSTVTSWENDRRGITNDDLVKLADMFGVTTDYILGKNNTPKWATEKDSLDLKEVLDGKIQPSFNFGGEDITDDDRAKLNLAITQIFWKKLAKQRKKAERDGQ